MKLTVDAHDDPPTDRHAIQIYPGKPLVECGKTSFTNLYNLEYFS